MTRLGQLACVAVAAVALSMSVGTSAEAGACFKKAASGTAGTKDDAKFQVMEALLQSFDWGVCGLRGWQQAQRLDTKFIRRGTGVRRADWAILAAALLRSAKRSGPDIQIP